MKTAKVQAREASIGPHRWLGVALPGLLLALTAPVGAQPRVIDGAQTYQQIEGFGVNANHRSWNGTELQPVLDALVDGAGFTLFRVIFDNSDWEATNDNADPEVMNWTYYNGVYSAPEFQRLWGLMAYLNQRGITNGLMLNFQGPGPSWLGGTTLSPGLEAEWAEMVASLLVYARNTRHLQFSLVAPNNEPDLTGMGINTASAGQYVNALHDLAQMLDTNGLGDVRFVAPDLANTATSWLTQMINDPVVLSKVAHFGLHSYVGGGGGSAGVANFLQQSDPAGLTFWMTEFNVWCGTCESGAGNTNGWAYSRGTAEYLLSHLANGASAGLVWEGYDSYYVIFNHWSFWGLFGVDNPNATPKTYTPRKNFYTLAQIAKFVRPGAWRINVGGPASPLTLLAFYQPDTGQLTLTGVNTSSSPATMSAVLTNLPPVASLDLYYTDSTTNLCHSATVPLTNGAFAATVPPDCVFTFAGFDPARMAVSVLLTNPVEGARFTAPATIPIQATASTTTGSVTTVAFFADAIPLGQVSAPPYGMTWSNVAAGFYSLTAGATNSLGNSRLSPPVRIAVVGPPAQISILPTNAGVVPYGTQLFSATATDALGSILDPPPAFAWSVNGGGTIDANGLFTAGGGVGGPFVISASSAAATGSVSVTIATNVNLAPEGLAFIWYSLLTPTDNSPQLPAPAITDGDLNTDVPLLPGGGWDNPNAYEAAGVIWATPEAVNRVLYDNGSYTVDANGVFAADFRLQFSFDGTSWTNAGPEWGVTPAYLYNSPASANTSFVFSGGVVTALGVRCLGRVRTTESPDNSWVASATEVQAIAAPAVPAAVLSASADPRGGIALSWPGALTNYALESATNLNAPVMWTPLTNSPQPAGNELTVIVPPRTGQQFFRLHGQ